MFHPNRSRLRVSRRYAISRKVSKTLEQIQLRQQGSFMVKNFWLIKSEPDVFSFEDLANCKDQTEPWNGIRNYQARNFMRDSMKKGDLVIFYHSNAGPEVGAVGLATVASEMAYPDPLQFDLKSEYYDAKAPADGSRWLMVDFKWAAAFKRLVTLKELKETPELESMLVVQRGQRLSIQPVEKSHFTFVCKLGGLTAKDLKSLGA